MNDVLYVVGFDLNDAVSQISYVELNEDTPKTLAQEGSEKKLGIPTVLCKRKGVAQWYYGSEAVAAAGRGDGVLATKLLGVARNMRSREKPTTPQSYWCSLSKGL